MLEYAHEPTERSDSLQHHHILIHATLNSSTSIKKQFHTEKKLCDKGGWATSRILQAVMNKFGKRTYKEWNLHSIHRLESMESVIVVFFVIWWCGRRRRVGISVVFAAAEFRGKATLSQPLDLAAKRRNPAAVPPMSPTAPLDSYQCSPGCSILCWGGVRRWRRRRVRRCLRRCCGRRGGWRGTSFRGRCGSAGRSRRRRRRWPSLGGLPSRCRSMGI